MPFNLSPIQTDVLVIGAGPTGLMAANQLNRFGIDFIIIDAKKGPTVESRAIAVTARSLEIYEQMGLSDEVVENGQKINSFHFFTQGRERGKVVIGEIGKGYSDFNFLLAFEQSKNEELLSRNLSAHGKEVLWETTFIELKKYDEKIVITAQRGNDIIEINAAYLIACDGAGSPVRHQLKMKFEGGTYMNKFFVADTLIKWPLNYDGLVVVPGDRNFMAFFPMKGVSNFRIVGTLPDDYKHSAEINFNDIREVIADTVGIEIKFEKVNWFSVYLLHHRRVDDFKKGRVFVAGDAAHIHSPAGGQGMNTGLQDAYNLAWKLAFVLKGYAKQNLLDTYNEERLPFAKWLMSFTDRGFKLMTSDHWLNIFLRKHFASKIVGFVLKFRWVRPIAFKTVSQIAYSYNGMSLSGSGTKQKLKFKAGDRLPYVLAANSSRSIYHLFAAPCFHLLHIGDQEMNDEMINKLKDLLPFPVKVIENKLSQWAHYGVRHELYILVRPDNYILYLSDTPEILSFRQHLTPYFILNS